MGIFSCLAAGLPGLIAALASTALVSTALDSIFLVVTGAFNCTTTGFATFLDKGFVSATFLAAGLTTAFASALTGTLATVLPATAFTAFLAATFATGLATLLTAGLASGFFATALATIFLTGGLTIFAAGLTAVFAVGFEAVFTTALALLAAAGLALTGGLAFFVAADLAAVALEVADLAVIFAGFVIALAMKSKLKGYRAAGAAPALELSVALSFFLLVSGRVPAYHRPESR